MDAPSLFFSMMWSAVGLAFFVYGKKRKRPAPVVGGAVLMALAWFARTPLSLNIAGIAVVLCIYFIGKRM